MLELPYKAHEFPSFRIQDAIRRGAEDKWCFYCWGGLGDRVCAEPTIRWAHENLRYKDFAIATDNPELFDHIDCKKFKIGKDGNCPIGNDWTFRDWYTTWTIQPPTTLQWEFFSHCMTQAVDYVSLSCLRMQLPMKAREIRLPNFLQPNEEDPDRRFSWVDFDLSQKPKVVVIHPGKHWPSKTFPASWWRDVCVEIARRGLTPMIIGKTVDQNVGTVDFIVPETAIDLRDRMSLRGLVHLLKNAPCLISNDSSPIHIASAGDAFVGVLATCKHPDFIGHWRHGEWQWRFKNLSRTGLYDTYQVSPFIEGGKSQITVEDISPEFLAECLPEPSVVADFAEQSVHSYYR